MNFFKNLKPHILPLNFQVQSSQLSSLHLLHESRSGGVVKLGLMRIYVGGGKFECCMQSLLLCFMSAHPSSFHPCFDSLVIYKYFQNFNPLRSSKNKNQHQHLIIDHPRPIWMCLVSIRESSDARLRAIPDSPAIPRSERPVGTVLYIPVKYILEVEARQII